MLYFRFDDFYNTTVQNKINREGGRGCDYLWAPQTSHKNCVENGNMVQETHHNYSPLA